MEEAETNPTPSAPRPPLEQQAASSAMDREQCEVPPREAPKPEVTHIVVVGFHHQHGPKVLLGLFLALSLFVCPYVAPTQVEFIYPPLMEEDGPFDGKGGLPAAWENLPFLALPDGVHRSGRFIG